ncbi:GtrA family protein [bacterium]|nr:GtrA family protein [bacterium]
MKKSDAIISSIIGFFIGIFFFIVLKNTDIKIPFISHSLFNYLLPVIFSFLAFFGMLIASFLGKKFLIIIQGARFILVGALNTFVDLGVLNSLIWLSGIASGFSYSLFKGISFLVAVLNSYFWNKYWTFSKTEEAPEAEEFFKFLIVATIGFFLNVGIASFVVNIIGPQFGIGEKIWANVGALTATMIAWIWNFLGSKFIVFKK